MKVLLSIKPEFVDEIVEGNKRFEYRKNIFKNKDISCIVVYATKPTGKIIGEFEIENILHEEINNLWNLTKQYSGISEKYFFKYFYGKHKGFAIKIKKFKKYKKPLELKEFDEDIKVAPQSFCYIK